MYLYSYLKDHDISFEEKAFDEIDALTLSRLAFYNFEHVKDGDTFEQISKYEILSEITNTINLKQSDFEFLKLVLSMKRYAHLKVKHFYKDYDTSIEMQYASLCFEMGKTAIFAFRGTDGTLVGWKENFNMISTEVIPSQRVAINYFEKVMEDEDYQDFYLIGHSKGGNLAVYIAANCSKQYVDRIIHVYNFDGPGFYRNFYQGKQYISLRNKITKLSPEESIIGRILYNDCYEIIKSKEKMFLQHWPFFWIIENDKIKRAPRFAAISNTIDLTLDDVQDEKFDDIKVRVFNAIFDELKASNKEYLDEVIFDKKEFKEFCKRLRKNEDYKEVRRFVFDVYKIFRKHNKVEKAIEKKILGKEYKKSSIILTIKDNILKNFSR